ncbi:MAG TPA: formate dehydrogenase accessory sulfurtransferase FdhD [Candidatus Dormibacteraeota bacterium]|nr:formate dehydrogenase accessory sulfurtransferase FdhD [Candidatus Dormibacteraeota bacterium]
MSDRASHRAKVLRYGDQAERRDDQLAAEEPLELRLDGEPLTVMMRTPGHDRELALGFCYGEGIIRAVDDVTTFTVVPNGEHPELENVLDLQLASTAPGRDARWQRQFFAASSCGLCGVSSIEAIHSQAPPLPDDDLRIAPEVLFTLDERLRAEQAVFARTGGLHAAGLFTETGDLLVVREDVGRHNAVDKVIGYALEAGLVPLSRAILLVSGRTSFEIVQKALMARIPVLVAVSAPSSLARDLAQASNQTLVGFLRGRSLNVYSGNRRVGVEPPPSG